MTAHLRANLLLLGLTVIVCAILYPLAVLGVGKAVFPSQAGGSIIEVDGAPVGSRLLAQATSGEEYFHPRPSSGSYDASASGGSNLAPSNPQLRERVAKAIGSSTESIPADAVTTSASGLDPHITLRNARRQVDRVTAAWIGKTGAETGRIREAVERVLTKSAFSPLGGLAGEPLVNVLETNLALREEMKGLEGR